MDKVTVISSFLKRFMIWKQCNIDLNACNHDIIIFTKP